MKTLLAEEAKEKRRSDQRDEMMDIMAEDLRRMKRAAKLASGSGLRERSDVGERQAEASTALRHVVRGLAELNVEGLERLEERIRSLEERLDRGGT